MKTIENILLKSTSCTGCGACAQSCAFKCIKMQENEEGFLYPQLQDIDKCVDCGKCVEACPIGKDINNIEQECYGFTENDDKRIMRSSSGGAFHALATSVIEAGGYVFGSVYNDNLNVITKGIHKIEELDIMCGSKYVMSNTMDVYSEIKGLLQNDELVMYCSTPCQIAGLRCYLKKDYNNLFLIDLLCAGAPSQLLFSEYIKWIEKKSNCKIVSYEFRDRSVGWEKLARKITFKNGKTSMQSELTKDPYYASFLARKTLRESCYECMYTTTKRWGDISIGDFWGVQKEYNINIEKGISAIIINSVKGKVLFDKIKKENFVFDTELDRIVKHNYSLMHPAKRHPYRDEIYKSLVKIGFDKTAKKYMYTSRGIRRIVALVLPETLKTKIGILLKLKYKG